MHVYIHTIPTRMEYNLCTGTCVCVPLYVFLIFPCVDIRTIKCTATEAAEIYAQCVPGILWVHLPGTIYAGREYWFGGLRPRTHFCLWSLSHFIGKPENQFWVWVQRVCLQGSRDQQQIIGTSAPRHLKTFKQTFIVQICWKFILEKKWQSASAALAIPEMGTGKESRTVPSLFIP